MINRKQSLRIAFCHPDLGLGGAERLVIDAASELCNHGHTVSLPGSNKPASGLSPFLRPSLCPIWCVHVYTRAGGCVHSIL